MGLTGFNRQRKRELAKIAGNDAVIVNKLFAHGYTTPELVKKASAKELSFLSEVQLKVVKGKKAKKAQAELDGKEESVDKVDNTDSDTEKEQSGNSDENNKDLDEEFLALPEGTVFPHKFSGGWHYLSNGEKINGKANAEKAQAELDGES